MGRAKIGVAVAGVIVMLLGAVTLVAMRNNGGSNHADAVVSVTSDPTPATTMAPGTAPAAATPSTNVPQPSIQDIQKVIAGLTTQVQTLAASNNGAPLTEEQVNAQVREQLKQLGINY